MKRIRCAFYLSGSSRVLPVFCAGEHSLTANRRFLCPKQGNFGRSSSLGGGWGVGVRLGARQAVSMSSLRTRSGADTHRPPGGEKGGRRGLCARRCYVCFAKGINHVLEREGTFSICQRVTPHDFPKSPSPQSEWHLIPDNIAGVRAGSGLFKCHCHHADSPSAVVIKDFMPLLQIR